ncbi:MAG: conjugal transfer protein [Lachnospiraceae bacterium]|nr:conjugal transfer protein [Lachnospiraceae bacterium]
MIYNLKVFNNWGLCPKCGKKCIKLNQDTILINYPMFCKVCKKEYLVSWKYNNY